MNDRKSISAGSAYFQRPIVRWPSSSQSMNNVSEAITPAAAGMGKPVKLLSGLFDGPARGDAVKAGQSQRAAGQVNKRDHPAEILEFAEHDLVDEQRRRHSERNDVGQRIEFSPEIGLS